VKDVTGTPEVKSKARSAWSTHLGGSVELDALVRNLSEGSLPRAFHTVALANPYKTAVIIDGSPISHGELDERADRLAQWLRTLPVQVGARILLCGPTSVGLIVAYLGALRIGGVAVFAGPTLTDAELRYMVEDCQPVAAFAAGDGLRRLQAMAGGRRLIRELVSLDRSTHHDPSLEDIIAERTEPMGVEDLAGDQVALCAYTSGTTGQPKATPLTHGNLLSSIRGAMLAWRWTSEDILVHALPLFHQHGLGGVHATLIAGSTAILHGHFDPERICREIESRRATVFFAVPAMYQRLVTWDGFRTAKLSSLRVAISGSAPLPPALAREISLHLGHRVLERYGTTESGLDVSNPYEGERETGAVGLPLPGIELAVVDSDGRPVADGEEGEVVLRGPQIFSGYWGKKKESQSSFYAGGWFRTGDVGRIDPDSGYLSIVGRIKDLIISGGLNVYPREVEAALETHPSVAEVAVLGLPSAVWGEEVTAFVVVASGASLIPEDLIAHARKRLASYKCPKAIIIVDSLPRNPTGKLERESLA
jgi:malonyl-CoA/methylmalonyl-CoA synthetase